MILMQGKDIMRAIGRGGPSKSRRFWGLKCQQAKQVAIWLQKSRELRVKSGGWTSQVDQKKFQEIKCTGKSFGSGEQTPIVKEYVKQKGIHVSLPKSALDFSNVVRILFF